jgi:hypothetical protein
VEIWKNIKGYEGKYQVSNLGRIKSLYRWNGKAFYKREHIMESYINNKNGYIYIALMKNNKNKNCRLHRLVAEAFIPNPENKPQVNHIDGDKTNNNANNLEWCTQSENELHAYNKGLANSDNKKFKVFQYDMQGNLLNIYDSLQEASDKTGVHISKISYCINNKYKYRNKREKYVWKKEVL